VKKYLKKVQQLKGLLKYNKMAKKSKLSTPDWIKEGYDSLDEYNKAKNIKQEKKSGKIFKIKGCPKCGSDEVGVVLSGKLESEIPSSSSESQTKEWECRKCGWIGQDIVEKELNEDEFMKYLDEKGEEIP